MSRRKVSGLDHNLPQAVTLGRFLEQQKLEPLREDPLFQEELLALAIQTLSFGGQESGLSKGGSNGPPGKSLSLPLAGSHVHLEDQGKYLRLRIAEGEEKTPRIQGSFLCAFSGTWEDFCTQAADWMEREKGRILGACEAFTRNLTEQITQGYGLSILAELKKTLGVDIFLLDKHFKLLSWEGGGRFPFHPVSFVTPKLSHFKSMDLLLETPLGIGKWNDAQYKELPLSWYPLAGHQGVLGYIGLGIEQGELNPVG